VTAQIIQDIETLLATAYGFDPLVSASDHLVGNAELQSMNIDVHRRAAVIFDDSNTELFIGLYLDGSISDQLSAKDPSRSLGTDNLDALCVLAEEVSHFHLILQRKFHSLSTHRVELEWQAEVDKLLVSSQFLYRQHGNPHLKQLRQYLYDIGVSHVCDDQEYKKANDLAARFWHIYDHHPERQKDMQDCTLLSLILKRFYRANLEQKYSLLGQMKTHAA